MHDTNIKAPKTHPYVVSLQIDPVDLVRLEDLAMERREIKILDVEDGEPDVWTVHVGCASQAVADKIEDGWG